MTEVRWPDRAYVALEDVLRRRSGLVFQILRRPAVETAAHRVMSRIRIDDADAFVSLVAQDGAVFDDLMAEVTIGETYFFREVAHFTLLRDEILPRFRRKHGSDRKFRAWSAGCSTGEEPYSIAITLREEHVIPDVVGTDVSRARLSHARRGEYRQWSFRGVPDATIARYFRENGDARVLAPEIRREVEFRYLNLASDCYPEMSSGVWGMDVIFCRNVLIYFDRDTICRVAESMMATLAEDGWILLGATDPPLNDYVACTVVQTPAGLVYRHPGASVRRVVAPPAYAPPPPVPPPPLPPPLKADSGITRAFGDVGPSRPEPETAAQAYARRDYGRAIALVEPRAAARQATVAELIVYVRALANVGRLEEAGRACALALEDHRDHAEFHYLHAVLVAQGGQFAESARAAKRALYLDRGMTVAHLALGGALLRTGDVVAARRAFSAAERLLAATPGDAPVPFTDNEPAGRMLEMTRMQIRLAGGEAR